QITLTIDGRKLDDAGLPDLIEQAPAKPPLQVDVSVDPGPQFHLGRISLDGPLPPDVPPTVAGLTSGQPALAADVVAGRDRLLRAIREAGYPLAKVDMPPATLHPDDNALDVTFQVTSGAPATFGPIAISGLHDMHESFVRQRLLLHQGEKFS